MAAGVSAGLIGDIVRPDPRRPLPPTPPAEPEFAPEQTVDYYPPKRTGLRGDHEGSFATAHELRGAKHPPAPDLVRDSTERYDLIVVGAGLSGLSAAYFYRQRASASARILVLENHDDFGGHATRNEFDVSGRLLLSYGGSQSIAAPESFSDISKLLMRELGIEMQVFEKAYDRKLYSKLGTGLFFDRETYGKDRLLSGMYQRPWREFLATAPLSDHLRNDLVRLYTDRRDYLPGMSTEDKTSLLRKISYAEFLSKYTDVSSETIRFFQKFPHDLFAVGIDAVSAWSCYHAVDAFGAFIYPGLDGLGLPALTPEEPYIYHFPDGNASVARLLVRALIPDSVPGHSMHDVVLAKVDYGRLDVAESGVRIRLNSTVVHARHAALDGRNGVEVTYARGNTLHRVRATHCILACYNSVIPYLCPDMPAEQRKALSYLVRMPFVYTHVALRNWSAFEKLGVHQIVAPSSFHHYIALDFPVSLGGYTCPKRPEEPAVLFMLHVPCRPGLSRREQNRLGRWELLNTQPETYERAVRDQLGRMLGTTGFDPSRDILGITVNRWAHGYAFVPNRLFDPEWPEQERPWVLGRRRWGQFAIANSDAGASAYMDAAIDQASRAVDELLPSQSPT